MRAWKPTLLLLGSLVLIDPAGAQSPAAFSPAERQIIARNALLSSAVGSEPALVRRALDALAKLDEGGMRAGVVTDGGKGGSSQPKRPGAPSQNPDLDRLERASPEALDDLFQLLKQAGRTKQGGKR
jgi:hypothetical protein